MHAAKLARAIAASAVFAAAAHGRDFSMEQNLTPQEKAVMFGKATEPPFSDEYDKFFGSGIYACKSCGSALYKSSDKFDSGCGWPAFDDAVPGAVARIPDADGVRTEIACARCGAHLGHVFEGERMTPKNTRHCVNSLSMKFIPEESLGRAVVAGGCFWGVEELMRKIPGVVSCVSGYAGGRTENPSYASVCAGNTGHLEAVEIIFDKSKISYPDILRAFFEIHDFTQTDGQGPDIGPQYLSAVFAGSPEQRKDAEEIIAGLKSRGFSVATKVLPDAKFHPAEARHQRFYERNGKAPYCHARRKIF